MAGFAHPNGSSATITSASTRKVVATVSTIAAIIRTRKRKNVKINAEDVIGSSATIDVAFSVGRYATDTTIAKTVRTRITSRSAPNGRNLAIPTRSSLAPIATALPKNWSAICKMIAKMNRTNEVAIRPVLARTRPTADASTGVRI